MREILPLLTADSCIVSFQNGFNEPDIQELLTGAGFGAHQVIGSIPNYGGALVDPATSSSCTRDRSSWAKWMVRTRRAWPNSPAVSEH